MGDKATLDAATTERKKTDDIAAQEKRHKQAVKQIEMAKNALLNHVSPDKVKAMLQKVIDSNVGGTAEMEAREFLKSVDAP
jgi:hypothetical protein